MVIQQGIVEAYGITWTNLSEKENWSNYYIILAGWVDRPILGLKERLLQDPLWELSTLFSQHLVEQDHARLE